MGNRANMGYNHIREFVNEEETCFVQGFFCCVDGCYCGDGCCGCAYDREFLCCRHQFCCRGGRENLCCTPDEDDCCQLGIGCCSYSIRTKNCTCCKDEAQCTSAHSHAFPRFHRPTAVVSSPSTLRLAAARSYPSSRRLRGTLVPSLVPSKLSIEASLDSEFSPTTRPAASIKRVSVGQLSQLV